MSRSGAALAVLLALAACGTQPAAQPRRYTADLTVLENPKHGPQLCASVNYSMPPQCGGPDIVGWDWNTVKHDAKGGVRWGSYRVVGTWDGSRLTLTERARPATPDVGPGDKADFASPCPAPEGGWRPVDPGKATSARMEQALSMGRSAKGYAGSWLDQSYLDTIKGYDGSKPEWVEKYANNPKRLVLNFRFTGDLAAREAWLREVWGGALCVSKAEHSQAKLLTIQQRLHKEVKGVHGSGPDVMTNRLHAGVWVLTEALQREVDQKYGKGVVVLRGILAPL